jgi:multidrug efflux pump subunit AcrA (membrane-fusion protein)
MTASCEFLVNQADNVLHLPSRAVREVGGQYVVSVLKGGQVTEVPVTVGLVGDDRIEIQGGLTEGQEVVLPTLGMQSEATRGRAVEFGRRAAGGGAFFRSSGPSGPPLPPR